MTTRRLIAAMLLLTPFAAWAGEKYVLREAGQPDRIVELIPYVEPPPLPEDAYVPPQGETVAQALLKLKAAGKRRIMLPEGEHVLGVTDAGWKNGGPGENAEIVIESVPGADRDKVILTQPAFGWFRAYTNVTYRNLSVDFANLSQFNGGCRGFTGCRWFNSKGWEDTPKRPAPVSSAYFFEDGLVHDCLYGPTWATRVERSKLRHISGDALQGCKVVRDVEIDGLGGSALPHHSDVFQCFGAADGLLYERVTARNVKHSQIFMFESFIGRELDAARAAAPFDPKYTIRNCVFRDITVEYAADDDPANRMVSHFMGYFDHVTFERVRMDTSLLFRPQFDVGGCRDVVVRDCDVRASAYPQGVRVE